MMKLKCLTEKSANGNSQAVYFIYVHFGKLKDYILFKEKVLWRWEFIIFQDGWMILIH